MSLEKHPLNCSVKQTMLLVLLSLTVLIQAQDVSDTPAAKPLLPTVDEQVAVLIEKMMDKETEHRAFYDLEVLGCSAVPAIINRMDDRRKLPDPHIALRNPPGFFELYRQYAPEEIVDALDTILNQITGHYFGSNHNGATEAERTKTIRRWRKFLRKTPATKLCDVPQPPKEIVILPRRAQARYMCGSRAQRKETSMAAWCSKIRRDGTA